MRSAQSVYVSLLLGILGLVFSGQSVEAWSVLNRLDDVIAGIELLDASEQRTRLSGLTAALDQTSLKNAPKAFQEDLVARFLIGDLESVNARLKKAEALSDSELTELTASLHPLLQALLEQMKVPHTCKHAHHQHKDGHHDGHGPDH